MTYSKPLGLKGPAGALHSTAPAVEEPTRLRETPYPVKIVACPRQGDGIGPVGGAANIGPASSVVHFAVLLEDVARLLS